MGLPETEIMLGIQGFGIAVLQYKSRNIFKI